jgi:hypothetical protein
MKSREVTDKNNTRWTCVQAFAGTQGDAANEAVQRTENSQDKVDVICTPSGGEQTVRLKLEQQWTDKISDEALVGEIQKITDHR